VVVVKRYLKVKSLADVMTLLKTSFTCIPSVEYVKLEDSVGRITATPIITRYSVPEIHLAAMDGISVKTESTSCASEQNPITLKDAIRINTGNVVPRDYDAVIMIEDVWAEGDSFTIRKAAAPWQHIRPAGEDIGELEMVLPSRHKIRPHELGALAAYGITEVEVLTINVGLIPTGSELVNQGSRPKPGQVVESNTVMATAILTSVGAKCTRYPMVRDDPSLIRKAISKAIIENEIVIVSAGSSAGTKDFTADAILNLGEVLVHGIAIKPGKPAIIGRITGKPVIGMPGYPLSALTVLREIISPLLELYGLTFPNPETVNARLTSTIHKDIGTDEFVLCATGKVGDHWVISPLSRGAGVQMSAVRANAYLKVPNQLEGFETGENVESTLMVSRDEAEQALLITGSHDPVLDHLANMLRRTGIDLHSTHAGSMGGILALKKDECHAAPMHLLAKDGSYNTQYLKKYLPGENLILVCVAGRQQGIVSRNGISFKEIRNYTFVNRQKGSGTRMLLDFELKKAGMNPSIICGYDREVTTHLAVALAVKSGEADAGICVYSAAKSLGLQFVPISQERYELVIRKAHMDDPRVKALIDTVASQEFKEILSSLGGYDTTETGVQHELP
jgi:putative molybdopterin biosynthesis protein